MNKEKNKNFEEILISTLSEFKSGMDKRFDSIDKRFDGIDLRLDGMDKRFDGIDLRLDGMDKRFDGIDLRLDGMDKDIKDLKRTSEETLSYVKYLDEDISSNRREIDNLQERVSKLDGLKYTNPSPAS